MIALLDYGAGNVRSVINAIESLGEKVSVVGSGEDIMAAEKLVFPGVGNFGSMMEILQSKGYVEPLKAYLQSDRPFLGICLGLQALFEETEEAPGIQGLGIIPGRVKRFDIDLAVPHIGWNGINVKQPSRIFKELGRDDKFYFVHSYHVVPEDDALVLTTTDYGYAFVSGIQKGNIIATQFHPEKSGAAGLRILRNFLETAGEPSAAVQTPRHTRLASRANRSLTLEEAASRDKVEIENTNKGGPIAMADFTITNEASLEDLRKATRKIIARLGEKS